MSRDSSSIIGRKSVDYGFSDSASRLMAATGEMSAHDATGGTVSVASTADVFTERRTATASAVSRLRMSSDAPDSADAFVGTGSDESLPSAVENAFDEDGTDDIEAAAEIDGAEAAEDELPPQHRFAVKAAKGAVHATGRAASALGRAAEAGAGGGGAAPADIPAIAAEKWNDARYDFDSMTRDASERGAIKTKVTGTPRRLMRLDDALGSSATRTVADTGETIEERMDSFNRSAVKYIPLNPFAVRNYHHALVRAHERVMSVPRNIARARFAASSFLKALPLAVAVLGALAAALLLFTALASWTTVTSTSASSGGGSLTGNALAIYTYLSGKGLDDEHIAGILGNLQQESGLDPGSPGAEKGAPLPKGPNGLAQWTGGRWNALKSLASKTGRKWNDMDVQLEYLWSELSAGDGIYTLDGFRAAKGVDDATKYFFDKFERAGDDTLPKRQGYARDFLKQMRSGTAKGGLKKVVAAAEEQLAYGTPYVRGGYTASTAKGVPANAQLDCSGLVSYCYSKVLSDFGRKDTNGIYASCIKGGEWVATSVSGKNAADYAEAGDILWRSGHTAIYIGGDTTIEEANPRLGIISSKTSGQQWEYVFHNKKVAAKKD